MSTLTSAAGLLAVLEEDNPKLQVRSATAAYIDRNGAWKFPSTGSRFPVLAGLLPGAPRRCFGILKQHSDVQRVMLSVAVLDWRQTAQKRPSGAVKPAVSAVCLLHVLSMCLCAFCDCFALFLNACVRLGSFGSLCSFCCEKPPQNQLCLRFLTFHCTHTHAAAGRCACVRHPFAAAATRPCAARCGEPNDVSFGRTGARRRFALTRFLALTPSRNSPSTRCMPSLTSIGRKSRTLSPSLSPSLKTPTFPRKNWRRPSPQSVFITWKSTETRCAKPSPPAPCLTFPPRLTTSTP